MLKFLLSLPRMKAIPRSGWLSHGVALQDVESVADHSFSTSAISLLLADLEAKRGVRVNVERVLRLAVLHDVSELLTFDISKAYLEYLGARGKAIKRELEDSAWKYLAKGIEHQVLARDYTRLHEEFAMNQTAESKIVHAADSLDILLQIIDYRRKGYPESMLSNLWNSANATLSGTPVPSARKIHEMIIKEAGMVGNHKAAR